MHVSTLKLEDIRNFPVLEIQLSKNINIIVGPNNSGKSSAIRSIYQLQNFNSLGISDIRLGRAFGLIEMELDNISAEARLKYFSGKNPLEVGISKCKVQFKIMKPEQEKKYVQILPEGQLNIREFHGLPASENENNFIYPLLSKRKVNFYAINSSTSNANTVMDTFQNLALKIHKVNSQPGTRRSYEKYCQGILGFLVTAITTDSGGLSLGSYSGNGEMIAIESMGDGVPNIIGLLSILLTDNDKLFLMEEPESELHPGALKQLLQLIIEKSDKNQFIISTHSNIVLKHLAAVDGSQILYTEAPRIDETTNYIPTTFSKPVGNSAEERLAVLENLGYDPFDFEIYKGYIIVEESSAERLIRDFVVPWFLPRARGVIRFISAQGVSNLESKFNRLEELFVYLHLAPIYKQRAWVIADGDPAGLDATQSLKNKFKSWDQSHFVNWEKPTFEEYYPARFQEQINKIRSMSNSQQKQVEKAKLLDVLINWLNQNPDEAKARLNESAAEIINVLSKIFSKLTID
jgi:AAA15 family ATPase/GTPase